ncbi:hypothetical protein [Mesorhizobium sp. M4B.F.Ca.ET.013.02.1.1]|uniref:hypothetical protein n=1 Tax=Mesorhizobium sp. M4B.F.Ca.ET.013.02.1.1 TaxID=2496755 RepID=UPI000FD5799C|nr:hypothetical protein [Mesorhizobium sp. M4B.F.Ca.ET.013.02.1.1]RUW18712.1 hypothetical protein EOA34_31425 [Mesorhizobium sp. M4B.F.Ca.ET.013.02.1.1]
MSALISLKMADAIFLFTDRGVYDRQFIIREFKRKVATAKVVPFAVATRGSDRWSDHVSEVLIGWAEEVGVDEAIATFAEAASELWKYDPKLANDLEIVVACISPTKGPQHFLFRNRAVIKRGGREDGTKSPVGVLEELGSSYQGCATDGTPVPPLRACRGESAEARAAYIGVTLMEHYRSLRVGPSAWDVLREPRHVVGGGIDMTMVSGVTGAWTAGLKTWPDRVGERINPFAGQKPKMVSRQQRRAAARVS